MTETRSTLLHPLLASRWSPTMFDPDSVPSGEEIESLLDAARWAPSAGNSQPWAFLVCRRGTDEHRRLVAHLAASSAAWAPTAGLLVANLAHRLVEDTEGIEFSEFSQYDLGQAVAHMSFQAQSLGLFVRQFRAFDRTAIATEFAVPRHWEVTTISAIGRLDAGVEHGVEDRERRSTDELRWPSMPAPR